MSRVAAVRREDVPGLEDVFRRAEKALGFVPNSFFAMARKPGILRAFSMLLREVLGVPGKVPLPLKRLAALMASYTTGCMYCTAHAAESAAAVSLFGWLNRWNDTMATGLEDRPRAFAQSTLAAGGWRPGKHLRK